MARVVIVLISRLLAVGVLVALLVGAATQAVDRVGADGVGDVVDLDAGHLDEAVAADVAITLDDPPRTTTIASWRCEPRTGRVAIFAPFRPPRPPTATT